MEYPLLFALGGAAYAALEIVWRGGTHWTMFLAGGVCLCWLQWLAYQPGLSLAGASLAGTAGVTGLEFAVGLFCTRVLHLSVWDYSREWGNYAGLICPKYTLLWLMLCTWVVLVMRLLAGFYAVTAPSPAFPP